MPTPMIYRGELVLPAETEGDTMSLSTISLRERFDSALKDDAATVARRERDRKGRKPQAGAEQAVHVPQPFPQPHAMRVPAGLALDDTRLNAQGEAAAAESAVRGDALPAHAGVDGTAATFMRAASASAAVDAEATPQAPAAQAPANGTTTAPTATPQPAAPLTPVSDDAAQPRDDAAVLAGSPAARGAATAPLTTATKTAPPMPRPLRAPPPLPAAPREGTHLTYAFRTWAPGHSVTAQMLPPALPGGELRAALEPSSPDVARALIENSTALEGIQVAVDDSTAQDGQGGSRNHGDGDDDEDAS